MEYISIPAVLIIIIIAVIAFSQEARQSKERQNALERDRQEQKRKLEEDNKNKELEKGQIICGYSSLFDDKRTITECEKIFDDLLPEYRIAYITKNSLIYAIKMSKLCKQLSVLLDEFEEENLIPYQPEYVYYTLEKNMKALSAFLKMNKTQQVEKLNVELQKDVEQAEINRKNSETEMEQLETKIRFYENVEKVLSSFQERCDNASQDEIDEQEDG